MHIVKDCDTCPFHNIGSGNKISVCRLSDKPDTAHCTFGKVPKECPLLIDFITFGVAKNVIVMGE